MSSPQLDSPITAAPIAVAPFRSPIAPTPSGPLAKGTGLSFRPTLAPAEASPRRAPEPPLARSQACRADSAFVLIAVDPRAAHPPMADTLWAAGFRVKTAVRTGSWLELAANAPEVVIIETGRSGADDLALLRHLRARHPHTPVIMVAAQESVDHAVEAMKCGAFDCISTPVDGDRLVRTVASALAIAHARGGVASKVQADDPAAALQGRSPAIAQLRAMIRKLGRSTDATVLLTGESGSGKDLVARAVHASSSRHACPFVNVTCTALPAALLESELFGHERGAFTDAKARHLGLFEQARGGTLFLDEIGDMELPVQAKLLRVLEGRQFRRVGGTEDITADVRIVAATNADLMASVEAGRFREDLYYRLAVVLVEVPSLREHREDVELLAESFLEHHRSEEASPQWHLTWGAVQKLERHDWPGNVRELRNVIERAVVLTDGPAITAEDLQLGARSASSKPAVTLPPGGLDMTELERDLVVQALERTHGNVTHAAALLGMNRDQVRYRVQKYRLAEADRA